MVETQHRVWRNRPRQALAIDIIKAPVRQRVHRVRKQTNEVWMPRLGYVRGVGLGFLCAILGFFVSTLGPAIPFVLLAISGGMIAGGTMMGFRWS